MKKDRGFRQDPGLREKIKGLLKRRKAVLLVHNYQPPDIQEIADLCGDSLELSIQASRTDAEVIVFCGVLFMAETASILSPGKKVLLPRPDVGCPMADMVTPEALSARLAELAPMPVVTCLNSSAAVKALSTICCTSANVVKVVESLADPEIMLTPDRNLARYAASRTGKTIHAWEGNCPIHDSLTVADVRRAKTQYPDALFMAHPQCRMEVLELADVVESTSGMIRFAGQSAHRSFIVGTEIGLLYRLHRNNPDKIFHPACKRMECPDMKKITLEDVARCLDSLEGQVNVAEDIRAPAFQALQRMLELGNDGELRN